MHFGLVAFDVFVEMYREEMANARGTTGWPQKPPLDDEGQIPVAIVAVQPPWHRHHLRAVQLSALTLYLKAKDVESTKSPCERAVWPAPISICWMGTGCRVPHTSGAA